MDKKKKTLLIAAVVVVELIIFSFLVFVLVSSLSSSDGELSERALARQQLTERVEKIFAQRFSVSSDSVLVDLGDNDPIAVLDGESAAHVTVTIVAADEDASVILASAAELQSSWVSVADGFMRIGTEFDVPILGATAVAVTQTVSGLGDTLTYTPQGFVLSGLKVSAEELLSMPLVGDWVKPFTVPQEHCIADSIPLGFQLTEANTRGDDLLLSFFGEDVKLTLEQLQSSASCVN